MKDFLNKAASYSRVHFSGRYKDVWTVPTKSQRLIFDLLGIEYHWKGKIVNDETGEDEIRKLSEQKA